jgi:hypothetical protein
MEIEKMPFALIGTKAIELGCQIILYHLERDDVVARLPTADIQVCHGSLPDRPDLINDKLAVLPIYPGRDRSSVGSHHEGNECETQK